MFAEALGGKSGRGVKQAAIQLFADSPQPAVLKRNRVFRNTKCTSYHQDTIENNRHMRLDRVLYGNVNTLHK